MFLLVPSGSQPGDYTYDESQVTSWDAIYDPILMQQFLLERNRNHFKQAIDSPSTSPLFNHAGFSADTPTAVVILQGKQDGLAITSDLYLNQVLRECCQSLQEFSSDFTSLKICKGFSCWQEVPAPPHQGEHWHTTTFYCILIPMRLPPPQLTMF